MRGAWVRSLVREIRSRKPWYGMTKKKKRKKSEAKSSDAEVGMAHIYVPGIQRILFSCQCMLIGSFTDLWHAKMLVQEFES